MSDSPYDPREPDPPAGDSLPDHHGAEAALPALESYFAPLLRSRVRRSPAWPELARRLGPEDVLEIVWLKLRRQLERTIGTPGTEALRTSLRVFCDRTLGELLEQERTRQGEGRSPGTPLRTGPADRWTEAAEEDQSEVDPDEELGTLARLVLSEREQLAWQHVDRTGYTAEEVGDLVLDCSATDVEELLEQARAKLVPLQ